MTELGIPLTRTTITKIKKGKAMDSEDSEPELDSEIDGDDSEIMEKEVNVKNKNNNITFYKGEDEDLDGL